MRCGGKDSATIEDVVLGYSSGDALNDLMFAAGPVMRTTEYDGVRMDLEVEATSDSGSIEVFRKYQLSNDAITWDSPSDVTTDTGAVSSLGWAYGTAYTSFPATKRFVRFGFTSNQKAGTAIEQIRVRVRLNLASR